MLVIFLKSLLIGYSGAIMPGAMLTYTINKSICSGSKSGFIISLGHSFFELLLVIVIFVGAGKYPSNDITKTIIGIIGGIVLGYLGIEMIKDVYLNKISLNSNNTENDNGGNMFLAGMILSATNPYFIIWWSVVGLTLIVGAYNSFGIIGIMIFYFGHIISDISWFTFVSLLVSKTRHLINIKIYKSIIFFLAVCLICFGISSLVGSTRSIYGEIF